MSKHIHSTKLRCEELEIREVLSQYAVQLVTPGGGFIGITSAAVSGELGIRPQYPPNADGYSIVEADSAADRCRWK